MLTLTILFILGQDGMLQVLPGREVLGRVPDWREGVRAVGQECRGEEEGGTGQADVTGRGVSDPGGVKGTDLQRISLRMAV